MLGDGPSVSGVPPAPEANDGEVPRAAAVEGDIPILNPFAGSFEAESAPQMDRISPDNIDVPGTLRECRCRFSCC